MEDIVTGENKSGYLSPKSIRNNEVKGYLQMLMLEYNEFQQN